MHGVSYFDRQTRGKEIQEKQGRTYHHLCIMKRRFLFVILDFKLMPPLSAVSPSQTDEDAFNPEHIQ